MVILGGCGNSTPIGGAGSGPQPGRNGENLHWSVRDVEAPRTFIAQAVIDHCVGRPEPKIGYPTIEYKDESVLITLRVVKLDPAGENRGKACAGVERNLSRAITIDRNLDQVTLFDGGVDPPEERWPE